MTGTRCPDCGNQSRRKLGYRECMWCARRFAEWRWPWGGNAKTPPAARGSEGRKREVER